MMTFLHKSKFPMINIATIKTITNQNCFLLWSDVFIFGTIHCLCQGITVYSSIVLYPVGICKWFFANPTNSSTSRSWRKLLCSPWKITPGLLVFCIFFVTVVSWSPSGPCNFRLLLVDLKNCVSADTWSVDLQYFRCNFYLTSI
jgi:hypothetical protein